MNHSICNPIFVNSTIYTKLFTIAEFIEPKTNESFNLQPNLSFHNVNFIFQRLTKRGNNNNNESQFGDTTLTKVFVGGLAREIPKTLRSKDCNLKIIVEFYGFKDNGSNLFLHSNQVILHTWGWNEERQFQKQDESFSHRCPHKDFNRRQKMEKCYVWCKLESNEFNLLLRVN